MLGKTTAAAYLYDDKHLEFPKQLQFPLLDVVYVVYSLATYHDVVTIHQVFGSGQLRCAFLLLVTVCFHASTSGSGYYQGVQAQIKYHCIHYLHSCSRHAAISCHAA